MGFTVDSIFEFSVDSLKSAESPYKRSFLKPISPTFEGYDPDYLRYKPTELIRKARRVIFGSNYYRGLSGEIPAIRERWKDFYFDFDFDFGFNLYLDLSFGLDLDLDAEKWRDFLLTMKRVFQFIVNVGNTSSESTSARSLGFSNLSVSEEFRFLILNAIYSENWRKVEKLIMPIAAAAFYTRAAAYHAVAAQMIALLLSVVYLHLIALVARGGGKTYSSGSLDFRSIYISILLFLGAHVWIKSRDVAPDSLEKPPKGVYRRSRENESGQKVYYGNFEPRFKPPHSQTYISVGSYESEVDAKNMHLLLAFYYGKYDGMLTLRNGRFYPIPPMTVEEQVVFSAADLEERKELVKGKAKTILEDCIEQARSSVWAWERDAGMPAESNQAGGGLGSAPGNNSFLAVNPVTQGTQRHAAIDILSDGVGGDASHVMPEWTEAVTNFPSLGTENWAGDSLPPGEQPLIPHLQQGSLQENQANSSPTSVIPDDLSHRRQLRELQGQLQLAQSRFEQQESRFEQQESRFQQQESRFQQRESRFEARVQQLESLVSKLQDEVELLRSTEHACKRRCT